MRFTTGQMPVTCSRPPSARPITPATIRRRSGIAGADVAQPAARDQAEDHRAQRRDEAQRQVAAAVGDKRRLARETGSGTTCRTPARGCCSCSSAPRARCSDAASPPARRPPDSRTRARHRIQRPGQPVADEDHARAVHCVADRAEAEQEQERVAEADLRQRVLEGQVGLRLCIERRKMPSAISTTDRHSAWPNSGPARAAPRLATRERIRQARRRPGTRTTAGSGRAASSPPTRRASGGTPRNPRNALAGNASARRLRCSTSAIISNITKPR